MTLTTYRVWQYVAILLALLVLAGGYFYFQAKAGARHNTDARSGLVGYWPFEEGSGTNATDHSGTGNAGTLTNMESGDWVDGKRRKALDFDGTNEYVNVADHSSLNFGDTTDMTVSGWFYRDTTASDDVIVAKRNGTAAGDTGYIAYIATSDNKLYFEVSDGTDEYQVASTSTFATAGWYHFAAVWDENDATNTEIYINGADDNGTDTGTIANVGSLSSAIALRIGSETDGGAPFDGKLDEIRVHNRALSTTEIAGLYGLGSTKINTSQNAIDNNGLIGLWSFNGPDVSGTTAYDRSGNGFNGTITNAVPDEGKVGQSLNFDGTGDYVDIGASTTLKPVNFTISVWTYMDTVGGTYRAIFVPAYSDSGWDYGWALYIGDDDHPGIRWADGSNPTAGDLKAKVNCTGRWRHISATFDGTTLKLYVDGVMENSMNAATLAYDTAAGDAWIGNGASWGMNDFDGRIDEVRFYNRAMTDSEIASLFNFGGGTHTNSSISTPQGTGRLDSGLLGYWKMDENSGTVIGDDSTNGNTGTLTNATPTWATGQIGYAVDFDGTDDYVNIGDISLFDFGDTQDFTITGWFNRDTATTDDTIVAKAASQAAADTGFVIYIDQTLDTVYFKIQDGTDQFLMFSQLTAFTSTGWHHFAVTFDNDDVTKTQIFIDGRGRDDVSQSGTLSSVGSIANTQPLRIGAESDDGFPFDGKLDEVRIYNRVLSVEEIGQLYRLSTPTGINTNLKGYWSFNGQDMSGTSAFDRSGAEKTGTLTNTPLRAIGKLGQGLDFPGTNQYVSVGSVYNGIKSVSFWIKADSTTKKIIDLNGTANIEVSAGTITANSFTSPTIYVDGAVASTIDTGWHHVAVTTGTGINASAVDIGRISTGYFDGILDEIRLYSSTLSATEVSALYNQAR